MALPSRSSGVRQLVMSNCRRSSRPAPASISFSDGWADVALGRRSKELMATEVLPKINKALDAVVLI